MAKIEVMSVSTNGQGKDQGPQHHGAAVADAVAELARHRADEDADDIGQVQERDELGGGVERRPMEIKRQVIENRRKDEKSPKGHLKRPAQPRLRQQRQETVGLRFAFCGEFPGRQPPHRGQGGRHHQQGGGDEGVAPVQRRVNKASQQASAQTAGHRGRDIRPHGHIQALQGQIRGQVSRQTGSQGGHKQPLDESGPHQQGEAGGGGAHQAAGRHDRAALPG